MALRWLFLDMNAFFASVEQQEHPRLRGRPVAVVPCLSDHTCCIAASYEARAFGIKTGTNVAEARRLCPHLCLVDAKDHRPYRDYSDRIQRAVEDCLPVTDKPYVDEMYCRLWANDRHPRDARALAERVKAAIHDQVGECLHCSVGLAPNRLLAKVATELQKPDGLVLLDTDDVPHKLFNLALTDFPGISKRMEARFHQSHVFNTEQMYALSLPEMRSLWGGIVGERWWKMLRGEDVLLPPTVRRCFSHSHVLEPEWRDRAGAAQVAGRLLERVAERMRGDGYAARGLSVHVKNCAGECWSRKIKFAPCADTWTLIGILRSLWEHPFRYIWQVGLVLYDVLPATDVTLSLFGEASARLRAARAVDRINQRFGRGILHLASVLRVLNDSEDKIAFGRVAGSA